VSEQFSDCCLTLNEQFFLTISRREQAILDAMMISALYLTNTFGWI